MVDVCEGVIINPASINLSFVDQHGLSIESPKLIVGQLPDGLYINSYSADLQTSEEISATIWRIGQEVTFVPLGIEGYVAPDPKTFVLGVANSNHVLVYSGRVAIGASSNLSGSSNNLLSSTGMNLWCSVLAPAGLILLAGLGITVLRRVATKNL